MIVICINIPEDAFAQVTNAMFAAGAGNMGNYDQCCFVTKGVGQFRPLPGSQPHIGTQMQLTMVNELKVETVCLDQNYDAVVQAMLNAHPYETPYWYAQKVYD